MKAATIVPQPYLHLTKDQDYHLALAHLIGKPGYEEYTEFYKGIGADPNKFLILDNGLIEGDPRPINELVEKAILIGANEIVLPDVYQDATATLDAIGEALDYVVASEEAQKFRFMAVPQGSTFEEWVECAKELASWDMIHTLSVPKMLCGLAGFHGRLEGLRAIQTDLAQSGKAVHLLGCWDSPLELKVIQNYVDHKQLLPVRGVDSAIAYVYSRAGLRMSEAERPEGAIDFAAADAEEDILKYNIEMWQYECGALPPSTLRRLW